MCGCGDPTGTDLPGTGGAASGSTGVGPGGLTTTDTAGGGATSSGSGVGSGGSGPCEFACGGGTNEIPGGMMSQGGTGTTSGGASGGTGGAAASGCLAGVGLCDDFEAYTDGQAPGGRWQSIKTPSSGTSLLVDSTKAFSGKQAVHIKVDLKGGGSVGVGTKAGDAAFAAGGDTRYVRFMLYQAPMNVGGDLHARLVRLGTMNAPSGSNGTGYAFSLHSYPKPVSIQLESMNDVYVSTRIEPPTDKWVCWEVQYGPGMIGWWQDGQTVNSPVPGKWSKVALEMLEIGFETFTQVSAELWIDDLVVDTKRIGCPTAP
ncbi:MAG TPA: hypothetical protein VHB79_03700 [Polyangiaceae bacterium]|nr:hypothetical protein [Polyangiaceae bacterium]